MPMPWTYRHASREFRAILDDAKDRMGLVTDNLAYTAMQGVLQVFRRRLTVPQALRFADLLPSVLRAIFVADWHAADPVPFASRAELTREAQSLRRDHNLTPDGVIVDMAWVLRRHIRQEDLDRLLAGFPDGAVDFWHVEVSDPSELDQRIV